jgi:hypothetical protein
VPHLYDLKVNTAHGTEVIHTTASHLIWGPYLHCPEGSSWPAVGQALDRIGVPHPGRFTEEFTFRRCLRCLERNLVRDGDFTCAICDAELPASWNFGSVG